MKTPMKRCSRFFAICSALFLCGCDMGFQKLEPGQHGVVFSALPTFLGGGVRQKAIEPGEMEFIFPWQTLYRYTTTRQTIGWGNVPDRSGTADTDYVETRTVDGNEVGLAITVDYRIEPAKLMHIVQEVAPSDDRVREIVSMVARADIRTHMNTLTTGDFFSPEKRQAAVEEVKHSLNTRFNPEGLVIEDVIYKDHRFERRLADNKIDARYQDQIDRTQQNFQETLQEEKKIGTEEERKKQEFNDVQAKVNRQIENAEGIKRQATLRGDATLSAQSNVAEQVRATGMAEVEGLKQQIQALSGPGGKAILRLQIARELQQVKSKFLLLNSSQNKNGGELGLNKLDTNELIRQMGIAVAGSELNREAPQPSPPVAPVFGPAGETSATPR